VNLLATLLDVLMRVNVDELTDRFVELYEAVASTLGEDDQEVAKAALADKRLDNDEAHARLQAKLEAAKSL
jgi:hypothetical protein